MTAVGRYIFCDIDGTLLYAKGAGRVAFGDAFEEAYGMPVDMSSVNFAGATDSGVIQELAARSGVELEPCRTRHFYEQLTVYLEANLAKHPPLVFPGVERFLQRVSRHWKLALVTGNIRACAYLKLRYGGLAQYFTDIGGFGDDDPDRNRMAALALERAGRPEGAVLLGDTPLDIEAARANGMLSVAVCNGQFDRGRLEQENPDIIVDSFEDAEHLFDALEV